MSVFAAVVVKDDVALVPAVGGGLEKCSAAYWRVAALAVAIEGSQGVGKIFCCPAS